MAVIVWNEWQISLLTRLWLEGVSAAAIAPQVGRSRNAVIGKVHRLKLSKRTRAIPPKRGPKPKKLGGGAIYNAKRARTTTQNKDALAALLEAPEPIALPPVEGGVSILDLEHHHCRAIVGAGPDGLARYCGASKEGWVHTRGGTVLSAYCRGHGNAYYQRIR